jgi:hypothetical protein
MLQLNKEIRNCELMLRFSGLKLQDEIATISELLPDL